MATATLIAPSLDVIAKLLLAHHTAIEISFSRFVFQAFVLGVVLLVTRAMPGSPSPMHAVGGFMLATSVTVLNFSLGYLQLATAIAIFFVEPLFVICLSGFLLKERLSKEALLSTCVGLVGAMLVIKPSYEIFGIVSLLPLASAACYASYVVATKAVVRTRSKVGSQFWTATAAGLSFLVANSSGLLGSIDRPIWSLPTASSLGLMALMGAIAAGVHLTISFALTRAKASALAPFQYLEIVGATGLGALFFGVLPDMSTFLGAAIIVSAGLYAIRGTSAHVDVVRTDKVV